MDANKTMIPEDLLDHALGQAAPAQIDRFERVLVGDLTLSAQLDRLRNSLQLLLDDGQTIEPPAGLAQRTMALVERRRRFTSVLDLAPTGGSFRLADLAVAAGIFLVGLTSLLPAIVRTQHFARVSECSHNLQDIGVALVRYADTHNEYPYTTPGSRASRAGTYASILQAAGLLPDTSVLDCPVNGRANLPTVLPTIAELNSREDSELRVHPALVNPDYAYNIGYVQGGQLRPLPLTLPSRVPLVSDRPAFDRYGNAYAGNSPNHGGFSQHVLTADGAVHLTHSTKFNRDDDIFHNRRNITAPGLDIDDYVLAPGITPFDGHTGR